MKITRKRRPAVDPNRRGVLWGTVGAVLAPNATARAQAAKRAPAAPAGFPMVINTLGGITDPNIGLGAGAATEAGGEPAALKVDINPRALRDARASGLTATLITLGHVLGPKEPFETTVAEIASWDEAIRSSPKDLIKVYSAADFLKARAQKRIGVIYGFQNVLQIGEKLDRVDIFADLGVRCVQLTYNGPGPWGDGAMAPDNRGLTPLGRQAIERLNGRRLMVDLSHSGEQTCLDAIRHSRRPVSINHTGCRALTDLPRNKTDAELKLVAERGGFVGIYFMPFLSPDSRATAEDVVAHIEHAVKVCGEDHVGIGTDGGVSAIDDMAAYDKRLAEEHERRVAAGIAAKGEAPGVYPFVPDLQGPGQFRRLAELLRKRGHTAARVEKIMGRNFLRYARDVWGS